MAQHTFNPAAFRVSFPAFADTTTYPDLTLQGYFNSATVYLSSYDGCMLNGANLDYALSLLTAHLAQSFTLIATGTAGVVVAGSTVGSVTVSMTPPPVQTAWRWWLSTTPYGAQLRSLLDVLSAGGVSVGGSGERFGFRKAFGVF